MDKRRPTIVDVAQRAGVSKSLVSLVLREAENVSDDARSAVEQAIKELGYRPNALARSLVERRSRLVGIMVSDLSNPFFVDVIRGASERAVELGYRAIVNTGDRDVEREKDALETMLRLQVDGLLVAAPIVGLNDLEAAASVCPLVVTNRGVDSRTIDSVVLDDQTAARLAVEHLVALGHRDIVHIDGGPGPGSVDRARGYAAAMADHGLESCVNVFAGTYTESGGAGAMRRILEAGLRPTAVFAANDMAALGALDVLASRGLNVPTDVSLVGVDDIFVASLGHVGLTSVRQDGETIGSVGVELLLERNEGRTDPRHLVVEPSLEMRATTTAAPRTVRR